MRRPLLLGIAILEIILTQTALDVPALAQHRPHSRTTSCCSSPMACVPSMVDDHLTPTMAAIARDG